MQRCKLWLSAIVLLSVAAPPARAEKLLYVSKYDNTIASFDVSLPTAAAIAASQRTVASGFENQLGGLDRIQGIDVGPDGNIYAVNRGASTLGSAAIERVTPHGVVTRFAAGLGNAWGIAFGADGNLYVPDANSTSATASSISRIAPNGFVTGFASGLPLSGPYGVAFDSTGTLYVSNSFDTTLVQVATSGAVSSFYSNPSSLLYTPKGLAWGPSGLYVANSGYSNVVLVNAVSQVASVFASSTSTTNPTDVAFDGLGNLFVSNYFDNTISKYDANGNLLLSFSTGAYAPLWLALDPRAVPEIDPSSAGSVLALCAGALAVLERRRRPGMPERLRPPSEG